MTRWRWMLLGVGAVFAAVFALALLAKFQTGLL